MTASGIYRSGEGFEERLNDVVRFVAVEEFEMKIAAGFIGEALEKFAGKAEAKDAGHVLGFFGVGNFFLRELIQAAPDEVGTAAEIHNTTSETFVHRHIGFSGERILRVEAVAVSANAAFVPQRSGDGLTESDAAIFDGVMCIYFQITIAE